MNLRLLAAAAVLAMIAGGGVAYCQHHGEDGPASVDCAAPAPPRPAPPRPAPPRVAPPAPPAPPTLRKHTTGPSAPPAAQPSVTFSARHNYRIDLDLDGDGC